MLVAISIVVIARIVEESQSSLYGRGKGSSSFVLKSVYGREERVCRMRRVLKKPVELCLAIHILRSVRVSHSRTIDKPDNNQKII